MLSYAYWSQSRAKCILKYLSPARILFHISQTRDLLKAFNFNVSFWKTGSPPVIYYSISCNHNNQLTFSKTRPIKIFREEPLCSPKILALIFPDTQWLFKDKKKIIILRNNAFIFQPLPSDYYNTTRDQQGQYVRWKQDSWHSLSTFLECKSRLIPYHYNCHYIIIIIIVIF